MKSQNKELLFALACTLIVVSYFQAWIPHKGAGLTLTGAEFGDWIKFFPEFKYGPAPFNRHWLYLPPITVALAMVVATIPRANRWQSWVVRLVAVGTALLALPSLPIILTEKSANWIERVSWIALVIIVAVATPWLRRLPRLGMGIIWMVLGVIGGALPSYGVWKIRPMFDYWLHQSTTPIGIGVWLNLIGQILLVVVGMLYCLPTQKKEK